MIPLKRYMLLILLKGRHSQDSNLEFFPSLDWSDQANTNLQDSYPLALRIRTNP